MDAAEPFSTPADAPLVPRMPFRFRDVEIVTAFYRSDVDAIRRLVPAPLEPVDDIVAIHVYKMNDTDHFGAYNESAVQVPVAYPPTGEHGVYSPYLFLDHDGGIAAGREVYGQPKKFGRPSIEVRHDLVVAAVERNGIDVVTLTVPYKATPCSLEEMLARLDFVTNFNLKVVPHVDGTDAIRQLTARELLDVTVDEVWTGPATVEIRPNAEAPVHRLPVLEMLEGYFWHCAFLLDYGRVLHDYLDGEVVAADGRTTVVTSE